MWKIAARFILIGLIGCFVSAPVFAQQSGGEKVFKWRFQSHWPAASASFKPLKKFFDQDLRKLTGGRLQITLFPAAALVPTKELFDASRKGTVDGGTGSPAYWMTIVPIAGVAGNCPMTFREPWEGLYFHFVMGFENMLKEAHAKHNLLYYTEKIYPTAMIGKKPIHKIEDFKGYKIRSSGAIADLLRDLGAAPTMIQGSELYLSLQTGVVEGAHWGAAQGALSMKLCEVAKYYIQPNLAMAGTDVILVNKDTKPPGAGEKADNNPYRRNKNRWPDVSILVPCYNEQKGVSLTVEKCFNQTYPGRIEILVIDDGSRDYTLRIAKIFEGPFPNRSVRVFHKPNGGKADALNYGFKKATGQIILTTDGDSHMDHDAVESIVRGYRGNPHAGVVGGFVVIRNEKESPLVKLQQIEYIFTQDVFRLPQSDSASVLIIPGPMFSMGRNIAKSNEASTRTCVEDADLTHKILADDWGTVAVTDATAHTQAPTTWKAWYKQRKRWVYGQFQVWRENKNFLKRNFWGVYNYFTWLSALFITAMLITSTAALFFIGEWNFFSLLITAQTTVIFILYFVTRGMSLMRYKYGRHLIKWLPLQVIYDLVNGVLCAYLFLRYLLGWGIKIKFGPELTTIH